MLRAPLAPESGSCARHGSDLPGAAIEALRSHFDKLGLVAVDARPAQFIDWGPEPSQLPAVTIAKQAAYASLSTYMDGLALGCERRDYIPCDDYAVRWWIATTSPESAARHELRQVDPLVAKW